MDFLFGEKEERFRLEVREFVKENIPDGRMHHMFDEEHDDKEWEFAMSMARKMAEKKWLTISWPKEFGGMNAPAWQRVVFAEEMAYWGVPGGGMGVSGTGWVGPMLMLLGTEEQKKKHLPLIASGDDNGVWCTGYSEPDSGSDLASMQTRAEKTGDQYVINGQKVWTSCAHKARWMWLLARTNPNVEKKHDGLSLILVDMKSEGVTVSPLTNFAGGHVFNEVFFKDVHVPVENLVGKENEGWGQLMMALNFERGTAIPFTASARRRFEHLVQYTKETGLMEKASVRNKLADLAIELESSRLLAYEPVWLEEKGMAGIHQASRDKAYGDMISEKLTRIGTEIIGAYAQLDILHKDSKWTKIEGSLEHLFYYCPGLAVAAGTTSVQKNITGQFGLQLPRSY